MTNNYISSNGYVIPFKNLKDIKKDLTVKPIVDPSYVTESYPVYRMNANEIWIPKFYGLQKFGPVSDLRERSGIVINNCEVISLRSDQKEFVDKILEYIYANDSCIGCAKTGAGKTVMALYIISVIKKKTLIIVHKEFLLEQWIDRIKQFLPDIKIGTIRSQTIDIENKDIVIGMLQSISMKEYDNSIFDDFGFVIVDECHHICSRTFSNALFKIAAKKMLGLSATPQRKDGLTKVLEWFLGPIITKRDTYNDISKPTVFYYKAVYSSVIIPKYNSRTGHLISSDLITKISIDATRNRQIVDIVIELLDLNRKILILSDRRNQCQEMYDMISKIISDTEFTVGLYLGSMSKEQINETNECDIILATYSMASEGYDNPRLDTLVFATGRTDIVQSCGRILRQKNENYPLIIDMVDLLQISQFRKRKSYYKKCAFKLVNCSEDDEFDVLQNRQISDITMFRSL